MIRKAEVWGGLFWLGVGAFVTWQGYEMGLGQLHEPGSGFAFFWIGVLMVGLALVTVVEAILTAGPDIGALWTDTRWGRILAVTALLLVYGVLFETIGFIPLSLGMLLFLMFVIDPVKWWIAIPVSFASTIGIWYVMSHWLRIQLPAGVLAPWIQ